MSSDEICQLICMFVSVTEIYMPDYAYQLRWMIRSARRSGRFIVHSFLTHSLISALIHNVFSWLVTKDVSRVALSPWSIAKSNLAHEVCYHGTAMWFIQGAAFLEWMARGSLLWIHGKRQIIPTKLGPLLIVSRFYSWLKEEYPMVCRYWSFVLYHGSHVID